MIWFRDKKVTFFLKFPIYAILDYLLPKPNGWLLDHKIGSKNPYNLYLPNTPILNKLAENKGGHFQKSKKKISKIIMAA